MVATNSREECLLPDGTATTSFLRVSRPLDLGLGLVAYYRFEGNADDSSAYMNHAANHGVTYAPGRSGSCGWFSGSSYLQAPQSASLCITNDMTISAWVDPGVLGGLRCLVDKDYEFAGYNLYLDNWGLHMRICASAATAGSLVTGRWSHVAGVYTGERIRLFVNGEKQADVAAGAISNRVKDVYIGVWGPPAEFSRYYEGYMDEVRIYNRALTPNEINFLAAGEE